MFVFFNSERPTWKRSSLYLFVASVESIYCSVDRLRTERQATAQISGPLHAKALMEGKEIWEILAKKEGMEEGRVGL